MYKKIISTLVIGTLLAGTLTGCGGSSDAGSSAKSSGKTELELFSTKPENKDTIQKLVDKYNESHDDVTVKVTAPPDAGTVLKTRMAKNDMPDIVAMGGDNNYTEVEGAGMLLDLGDQDYIKDVQEAYIDMVYDVNKDKEETIYGVPFATNASGVIYNTEKFEELGLEVPKTWDEFIDVLQKIKDAGEQPLLMTYKDAWTALAPWNSIAADLAPESFADDRKAGKTTFVGTHEEIAEKYLTLLDYAQDDYMGLSYDDGNKKFANGDAVMIINGNWAISQYRNANPDVKINMFALPSSNDESQNKVTSGVDVLLGVSKSSSNVDAAKDFVSFMMEESFADDRKAGKTTFVGTHEEIAEKYLTLLDYAQDDYMGLSYDDGNKKFANGDAVMIINGNWAISQYRNANPDVKINMFALPSSNDESQNKVTSGVDVLLGVSKSSSNVDAAKDFVSFMMEKENIQTYIDEQFSFSALKGVEQSDEAVSGVQEDISNGKVANFEDHYYPSGLDMAALVAGFSLNRANGMDDKENIDQFLKQCDEKYDVANVD